LGNISLMSKIEKIKRVTLIAIGFGMATYLIMSGSAILNKEDTNRSTTDVINNIK